MKRTGIALLTAASLLNFVGSPAVAQDDSSDSIVEEEVKFECPTDRKPSRRSYKENTEAKAIYRCKFILPSQCAASRKYTEKVKLSFDISVEGVPENIAVVDTSNDCMNERAIDTLSLWRYESLEEPELGAEVTFKVYSHSDFHRQQKVFQDLTRPGG